MLLWSQVHAAPTTGFWDGRVSRIKAIPGSSSRVGEAKGELSTHPYPAIDGSPIDDANNLTEFSVSRILLIEDK